MLLSTIYMQVPSACDGRMVTGDRARQVFNPAQLPFIVEQSLSAMIMFNFTEVRIVIAHPPIRAAHSCLEIIEGPGISHPAQLVAWSLWERTLTLFGSVHVVLPVRMHRPQLAYVNHLLYRLLFSLADLCAIISISQRFMDRVCPFATNGTVTIKDSVTLTGFNSPPKETTLDLYLNRSAEALYGYSFVPGVPNTQCPFFKVCFV